MIVQIRLTMVILNSLFIGSLLAMGAFCPGRLNVARGCALLLIRVWRVTGGVLWVLGDGAFVIRNCQESVGFI